MNEPSALANVAEHLLKRTSQIPAAQALQDVGDDPGVYAIVASDVQTVPKPFNKYLVERKHSCVYIGKSSRGVPSLRRRLVRYDLKGEGPSTFFCSLGLVLGYRPSPGCLVGKKDQNNFNFKREDARNIAAWAAEHLAVAWLVMGPSRVDELEAPLIRLVRPLLNLQHNPSKLRELEALRSIAREVARSYGA